MKFIPVNEKGSLPLIVMIAVGGFILFLVIANLVTFKDQIFNTFFPKPQSQAAPLTPPLTPPTTPDPQSDLTYTAFLQGVQEVPATDSQAWGIGKIVLSPDEKTAKISLQLNNLVGQTMAHIHGQSAPGANSGIIFTLPQGSFTDFSLNMTSELVSQLKGGGWYFNVHTNTYPNGEIRGQINRYMPGTISNTTLVPLLPTPNSPITNTEGFLNVSLLTHSAQGTLGGILVSGQFMGLAPNTLYDVWICRGPNSCGATSTRFTSDGVGKLTLGGLYYSVSAQELVTINEFRLTSTNCPLQSACLSAPYKLYYPPFEGDILAGDGKVTIFDYGQVLKDFRKRGLGIPGDIIQDQYVDIFDYNAVLRGYGKIAN